jgi:GNAT superfamily N-acetyltransferase
LLWKSGTIQHQEHHKQEPALTEPKAQSQQIAQATAFLRRDLLRNIVPLKLLHGHPQAIGCFYAEEQGSAGALLLLPTHVSPFDRATYPATDYVVLLAADGPAAGRALLDHIPADQRLVFKLPGDAERALVAQRFALRRTTAYISYSWVEGRQLSHWDDVAVAEQLDQRCLDLYEQQGHSRDSVQSIFAAGQALSCTYYRDELPVASCFAFRNFEHVWEVGGLFTLPSERRQGLGRRVVETALHALAVRGLTPRYAVHEGNQPSQRLAQAVSLRAFVTTTHFLVEPVAPGT